MEFSKNTILIENICLVQIRSVDGIVNIPNLNTVYHTPSKVSLQKNSKNTPSGVLHNKRLNIYYPGLSSTDFDKFNDLLRGVYQVYVKLDNYDIYEVSSNEFPMECNTSYNLTRGHNIQFTSSSPIPIKYRDNQPVEGINIDGFDYDFDFYVS